MTNPTVRLDVRRFLERSRATRERRDATVDACSHHIRRVRDRVAGLRASGAGGGAADLHDALEKLEASANALESVEAELIAQKDELLRSVSLLEQERAKYLDLFENAPDAYLVTDAQGVVNDANAAARALLDVGEQGLVGKPLAALLMSRDVPRLRFVLRTLADCALSQELDVRLRRKPMASAVASFSVRPLLGTDGKTVLLRWTMRMKPANDAG